jgi:hypothetical protein
VRVVGTRPDAILLEPAPADAVRLRSFGVRRLPRYTAAPAQVAADFLPRAAWREQREAAIAAVRARWPDLDEMRAAAIFAGEPYVGMSAEQAEAAVGEVVLERRPADAGGGETWVIGARSRSAELRLYTEGRERGLKTVTFEDYLGGRALALLTFRDGRLTDIGTP